MITDDDTYALCVVLESVADVFRAASQDLAALSLHFDDDRSGATVLEIIALTMSDNAKSIRNLMIETTNKRFAID